jgi:hypothetical protein
MGTSGPGGPLSRFWVGAEYLAWWINPGSTPPLLTTAPFLANDPNRFRGALSQGEAPFTTVLAGGNSLFPNEFNGARFTLGYWLDRDQTWGLEGRGFFLGARGNTVTADSMMFPLLARPFYNLNFQTPDAELVARPDLIPVGVASIKTSSQLWGAEANVRRNLITGCNGWLDVIGGFRYLQLDESIRIEERFLRTGTVTGAIPPFTPPYFQSVFDDFRTQNTFYGGQLGLAGEIRRGRWALDGRATVALGATNQRIEINGGQSITQPGQMPHSFTGGLLATPSNIGVFTRERFSVAPEVGLNVGYYLTERLKLAVGYNFLYWSNVVRPGDQIDPAVNVLYVPNVDRPANGSIPFVPAQRPGVPFRESDFWAHGLNVSLQFNW